MKGYVTDIERQTLDNTNFRHVVYTGRHMQLVLMSIAPGDDIGMETQQNNDQFFRIESGKGQVIIDGNEYDISDGSAIVVPAGAQHNVINTSHSDTLQLYTVYAPPHRQDGISRQTKLDATSDAPEFNGKTTE
jgi:mannose-6-phosphate isomerase-like protein (cupin superfamily)